MSSHVLSIPLPSLIHRVGKEGRIELQQLAVEHGCVVKRVRRSRNWQVNGELEQLKQLKATLVSQPNDDLDYALRKMEQGLEKATPAIKAISMEESLARLIEQNDAVTLAELMEATNCSMKQAREARFLADDL
ncbi:ribosome recycling factor family protein [Vibrio maerlii]|uniref:ribosome recycling factor family protein n=1 Tax=Vibrio maerlii TaxID=2231648 RepID=UPI000E3EB6C3|nr:ribosome recycling factor family protein [Vibrio maerlii]